MNTLEFVSRILPEQGVFYLAVITPDGRTAHKAYTSHEKLAAEALILDKKDASVYHACAAYKEPFIDGVKRQYRVQANQLAAKAFWVDIDCGEEKAAQGKGYATKKEGARAILAFCKVVGLPDPMLVSSGNGIHAYWPLVEAIPPTRWVINADALKAALKAKNVLVDAGVTADFARILRPIGTTNKKHAERKAVQLIRDAADTHIDDFERILLNYVSDNHINVDPPEYDKNLNSDLTAHLMPHVPSWAEDVAKRCNQVALMRDTKGLVNYEHWRGVIGIIKYCEEGDALAHAWSVDGPTYNEKETQAKLDTWNSPPTTCTFLEKSNPGGCQGCQFKDEGKFRSPIVLGRREEVPVEKQEQVVKQGAVITAVIPALPKGYVDRGGTLHRQLADADGVIHEHAISSTLFYPRARIKKEGGTYALSVRAHLPREGVQDFDVDQVALASASDLQKALATYQIVTTNNKDAGMHLSAYMKDWLEKLKQETDEQNTYQSFGWHDDNKNFLIGDRMYHHDGTVREVLVGSNAKSKLSTFPLPKGNLEEYASALQTLYGVRGQEYRQYAIASGFGSILTPLSTDPLYRGLVFALVGGDTAKGKTTLARAVLTAFGDAESMSIKTDQGATVNARYARMGTYRNIPVLIDELTNIDVDDLSSFCYTTSLGEEKERLKVGAGRGVGFAETHSWALSPFVTANIDLHSALASKNGNTQAEAVRMIQVKVDHHEMTDMLASEVHDCVRKMERNRGVAGDAYLKYVVTHRKEVEDAMVKWATAIETAVPAAKYRFYRGHAECSLAAIEITNNLGITNFDMDALFKYVVRLFAELAETVTEQNSMTAEDALSAMVTRLSPRFIVSREYRHARTESPEELRSIDEPAGRYIIGSTRETKLAGRLYISKQAVRDWCATNRTSVKVLLAEAERLGVLIPLSPADERFYLGRGTSQATGQTRCICIDYRKLQSLYAGEDTSVANLNDYRKTGGAK